MIDVVEFTSLSDKSKRVSKEFEKNILINAPKWCDVIRLGKGEYYLPRDAKGFYGDYRITEEKSKIYICKKLKTIDNSNLCNALFRDGEVREIEVDAETVLPANIERLIEMAKEADDRFFEEHPELPQYDY